MNFTSQIMNTPLYEDTDIVKKSRKYPEFYQQLLQLEENYINDLNMAIYANLDDIESLGVFALRKEHEHLYISFFAYLMPENEEVQSKFYLLWIRMLDEVLRDYLGKKYTIVYYHSLCESSLPFNFLAVVFKKLPMYYYAMLDKIYTIEASFFVRKSLGLFDFGRLFKLFERKFEHVQKLREFAFLPEVMKYNLMMDMPDRLMEVWIEKVKKKSLKWGDNANGHQSLPVIPVTPPKNNILMVELDQHKKNDKNIPVPLSILLRTLSSNPNILSLEGIFRKSGAIDEEEQIIDELMDMGDGDVFKNLEEYSGYSIAGVIKKFFTKLTQPIVPYAVYDRIMGVVSVKAIEPDTEISFVLDFMDELPPLNCQILFHFLTFLKKEIISREEVNKMNNYNMAVCIFPCIFKSKTYTESDLINSGKFVGLIKVIFTRFEELQVQLKKRFETEGSNLKGLDSLRISLA